MNENETKDRDTSGADESCGRKDVGSDGQYINPYSDFISKDEKRSDPEKEDIRRQNRDNPYSRYYSKRAEDTETFDMPPEPEHRPSAEAACLPIIDETAEKQNFSRMGLAFALFSLISFSVSLVIQMIVLSVNRELYYTTLFRNLLSPVSLYLFALPPLMIILSRCEARAPEKKRLGFGKFILFLITAFGFMYIGAMIGNGVMDTLSALFNYDYGNSLESIVDKDNIWITAFFTVIVAPIGEEFVFRKLLIDRTQKYGAFISIGLSGLMFGLMHGNFYQFFYAFALGILLGYIYYTTGKLYLTVLIHAIVNFVGSVLTSFLTPAAEALMELDATDTEAFLTVIRENLIGIVGLLLFDVFVYGAMACAVIFPIVFRKKLMLRDQREIAIPKKRVVPVVILNIGIMTMLIIYVLEFGLDLLPI